MHRCAWVPQIHGLFQQKLTEKNCEQAKTDRVETEEKEYRVCLTLTFPASLMASTILFCSCRLWLRMCAPDMAETTTSTCDTAATRAAWSSSDASTRRAPCALKDSSIWSLSTSMPISGRMRTNVGWPSARLARTSRRPMKPVPPTTSTRLFCSSMASARARFRLGRDREIDGDGEHIEKALLPLSHYER
jgi:hypothetical protein